MIIGIGGFQYAGKDTSALAVQRKFGFTKMALADELRTHMEILNPIVGMIGFFRKKLVRYNDAVAMYGYNEAKKKFPELRRLLLVYGSDIIRDRVSSTYWIERLWSRFDEFENVVISDVRMENEIEAVHAADGITIWVHNKKCKPYQHRADDGHVVDMFMYHVFNDGTIADLEQQLFEIINKEMISEELMFQYKENKSLPLLEVVPNSNV